MLVCAIVLALIGYAEGHAAMFWPPNWQDENGLLGLNSGQVTSGPHADIISAYYWFTNATTIPGEQTLDESMRTMQEVNGDRLKRNSPWLSPGSAPVTSPCGGLIVAKSDEYCGGGAGGFSHGPPAEEVNFPNVVTTQWKIGSKVEAFWGVSANHGGGYSYRLCKVPKEGVSGITEECFQQTPLRFAGEKQWFQFGGDVNDESSRIYFLANRTDVGTTPSGSQWTKNPIPGCNGFFDKAPGCPHENPHFEPIIPEAKGYGKGNGEMHDDKMNFNFTIGDNLQIPDDLEPGKYVLSWRMDVEESEQIWSSCSSINLVS